MLTVESDNGAVLLHFDTATSAIWQIAWAPNSKSILILSSVVGGKAEKVDLTSRTIANVGMDALYNDPDATVAVVEKDTLLWAPLDQFDPKAVVGTRGVWFAEQQIGDHLPIRSFWVKPPKQSADTGVVTISPNGKRLLWHYILAQDSLYEGPFKHLPFDPHLPAHEYDDFWVSNLDGSGMRKLWHSHDQNISQRIVWSPDSKRVTLSIYDHFYAAAVP
jgi:hypothetical protein